jgi:hypothetical protein
MHRHRHDPGFDFPVAVLAAGAWQRIAALLLLLLLLWLAIGWALWEG